MVGLGWHPPPPHHKIDRLLHDRWTLWNFSALEILSKRGRDPIRDDAAELLHKIPRKLIPFHVCIRKGQQPRKIPIIYLYCSHKKCVMGVSWSHFPIVLVSWNLCYIWPWSSKAIMKCLFWLQIGPKKILIRFWFFHFPLFIIDLGRWSGPTYIRITRNTYQPHLILPPLPIILVLLFE